MVPYLFATGCIRFNNYSDYTKRRLLEIDVASLLPPDDKRKRKK